MVTPQYTSLEEKQRVFAKRYCIITTPSEFKNWYEEHKIRKDVKHIFRGIKEASYKNFTSAQRYYFQHDYKNCSPKELIAAQINALRLNRQQLLQRYCYSFGIPCSDLFLLSFAQHHGGISPLLDFSRAVNTALFFMTHHVEFPNYGEGTYEKEHILNYMSMYYILRDSPMTPNICEIYGKMIRKYKNEIQINEKTTAQYWQKKINAEGKKLSAYQNLSSQFAGVPIVVEESKVVFWVDGYEFVGKINDCNLNLAAQQGCFVYHDEGILPLENELCCVDIHKSLVPFIREEILQEFFTEQTMFPNADVLVANALKEASAQVFKLI